MNLLKFEKQYWLKEYKNIAGIDEAGRGPLAGPVVAACVIFKENQHIKEIKDSKKLSHNKRIKLYQQITSECFDYGIGIVSQNIIDDINILQATYLAMKKSIGNLNTKPDLLLIDGLKTNIKHYKVKHIVNGDNLSQSIAAASIIAKVTRDNIMFEFDKIYSEYLFKKHKGYGTKFHIEALKKFKATPIHRKSFKIVNNNLPTVKDINDSIGMKKLASNVVISKYINNLYKIKYKDIQLSGINDKIDYLIYQNDNYIFVKIITKKNNEYHTYSKYKKHIQTFLKEKDISISFVFNVILIELIKDKKPKINIVYND